MDQLVALVIIFIVFVAGKIFETAQKKAQQSQRGSPSPQPPTYKPERHQNENLPDSPYREQKKTDEYKAPAEEVEQFLRDIGMLPPKPVPPPQSPPRSPKPTPVKKPEKMIPSQKMDTPEVTVQMAPAPSLPEGKRDSAYSTNESEQPSEMHALEKIHEILIDNDSIRTAFILNEIFQPPVALRTKTRLK